jgi:hypothetical protein
MHGPVTPYGRKRTVPLRRSRQPRRRNGNPIDQRMGGPSPSPLDVSPGRPNST